MTPTDHAADLRRRTPAVLVQAVFWVVVAVVVTSVVAGQVHGASGARGAVVGGVLSLVFFAFGSLVVNTATRLAPEAVMVVALTTYLLQVALVAMAFAVIRASGALGESLSPGWLAGGVVAATVAWTVGQLVATARSRVPVFDIELPRAAGVRPAQAPLASSRRDQAGAS